MSNENQQGLNATSIFQAAVDTQASMKLNRDIVNYADADPEQKAYMDQRLAELNGAGMSGITIYAADSSEELGEIGRNIIAEIKNSSSFLDPFDEFAEAMSRVDFDTLGELAEEHAEAVSRRVKLLQYSPVVRFFARIVYGLLGMKKTSVDEINSEIDKSLLQQGEVMAGIDEASDNIPIVFEQLQTIRNAFTTTYSRYGLDIGAAAERLRQLEEEELLTLQKEVQNGGSLLKQEELQDKYMEMTLLNKKITNMDNFHKHSLLNLSYIRDMMQALGHAKLNLDEKSTVSEDEWGGILAKNLVATRVADIIDANAQADEFARQIREQGVKVGALINQKAREALESGQIDAKRMTELLRNKAQDVLQAAQYLSDFNQRQKAARAELDQAGRELLGAYAELSVPLNDTEISEAQEEVKLLTRIPAQTIEGVVIDQEQPSPVVRGPNNPEMN